MYGFVPIKLVGGGLAERQLDLFSRDPLDAALDWLVESKSEYHNSSFRFQTTSTVAQER
jgi:hypothetical protein